MNNDETPPDDVNIFGILNEHFSKNGDWKEVKELLRSFKRPILLDFNNTLTNNPTDGGPLIIRPGAKEFIDELRTIGTVIIVTAAESYSGVHNFLEGNDCWRDDMVLMTRNTYASVSEIDEDDSDFLEYNKGLETKGEKQQLRHNAELKQIGIIFKKEFLIPLIDDDVVITFIKGGGIQGFKVEAFTQGDPYDQANDRIGEVGFELKKIIDLVRNYYDNL